MTEHPHYPFVALATAATVVAFGPLAAALVFVIAAIVTSTYYQGSSR
jgi:hypothetical protein